jgi:GT2 family glycosyltransferase
MDVSIIIVNYNTAQLVLSCVDSIKRLTHGVSYEIIVVDNHSDAAELAKLKDNADFTLLALDENVGFGRANNAGAARSSTDYMLFLNPDTELINDAVSILYDYVNANAEVGICGGNLFDADKRPTHSYHRLMPSILSEMDFACRQLYRKLRFGNNAQFNNTGKPLDVAMITGADLMIRRKAWLQVEGFDPQFFMYCEDSDLCWRVKQHGWRIVSLPQAEIMHLEGHSFSQSEAREKRVLDGRFRFFRKHYSRLYNIVADALNVFTLAIAVIVYSVLCRSVQRRVYSQRLNLYLKML